MANCCNFTKDKLTGTVLESHKRVRHFTGLVMGEDEFQQDQLYFMNRDERHQRALHGYGVVSGLGVQLRTDDATGNLQVVVAAGMAVNPRGESICVPQAQCGDLNLWLENHRDDLIGSPPSLLPGSVTLYLVLCARDCQTDPVPVLGDPCRTLQDATAASRIADDFEICLRLEPPQQQEELAVREFGEFLRSIEISDAEGGLSSEQLADLVRDLIAASSPPQIGQIEPESYSPPLARYLHPDDAAEALAEAYRVWIQEVRPELNPETGACEAPRDGDDGRCVLLACLQVGYDDVDGILRVSGEPILDNRCGPILVQSRLLQEMLLGGPCCASVSAVLDSPVDETEPRVTASSSHSDLVDLEADDHRQYLLVESSTRALLTDLQASGNLITGLGEPLTPSGDEAVRWDRAVKNGDPAGGDLSGIYPNPQVVSLQGNPIAPGTLSSSDAGNMLVWDGDIWRSRIGPFEQNLTRIIAMSWPHAGRSSLQVSLDGGVAFGLVVGFGADLGIQTSVQASTLNNNSFRVFLRGNATSDGGVPIFTINELRPQAVLPVNITLSGGNIGAISSTGGGSEANGVLFQIDVASRNALLVRRQQLFIQLAGDHILDSAGRAIDVEFPRNGLPSGDGPGGAELGIQGGRFDSWVTVELPPIVVDGLDLNNVDATELRRLPGISPILANRIVEVRDRLNGFESIDSLAEVSGLSDTILGNLRALLEN